MSVTFDDVVSRSNYSKSQIALRAGLSRTTALAVTEDPSRARISTLRELALAVGYDISIELDRASDPLAAAAARTILGERFLLDDLETTRLQTWIDRLSRYTQDDNEEDSGPDAIRVIVEAAGVAGPQHREGAVLFSGRNDSDRLVSVGHASGVAWALSGSASLEALGEDQGNTVVFWTDDVRQVSQLFTSTHRAVKLHTAASVIVVPAHPSVFVGMTAIDDVNLVSPLQGVIDAIAIGGKDRDIGERLSRRW